MERRSFFQAGIALGFAGLGRELPKAELWAPARPSPNGPIRLSANENPLGISPSARRAVIDAIDEANRYPGARETELIDALAAKHNVKKDNIALGNGSTEILQVIVQAHGSPKTTLIVADPTFEDVPNYSEPEKYRLVKVPLDGSHGHDLGRMREIANKADGPVLVYVCNPNNPTASVTSCRDVDAWIKSAPDNHYFMIDEAYFEFVQDPRYWTSVELAVRNPNVVVVRTFSKIYAMAGMRLGYAVAHADTIKQLHPLLAHNGANQLALASAIASLNDRGMVARSKDSNSRAKAILYSVLQDLNIEYLDSQTNFAMHRIEGDLRTYIDRMKEHGFKVGRPFPPMLSYNRVSIGLPDQMERFAEALRMFRKKGWV
ncbi:MAG: pyridoxal phosphate-dependent aminotransferase [Gemmatimonadales bacterium]